MKLVRNGEYEAENFLKDVTLVVKAGCNFKSYSGENRSGKFLIAEGPVIALQGFPFPVKSFECHCPKFLAIECPFPEKKVIEIKKTSASVVRLSIGDQIESKSNINME